MRYSAVLLAAVALLSCAVPSSAKCGSSPPGVVGRWHKSGIDYAAKVAVELLKEKINKGILVPDLDGKVHLSVGEVDYKLTHLQVKKLKTSKFEVKIIPGVGFHVKLEDAQLYVTGKFSYKCSLFWVPTFNCGSFELLLTGITAEMKVTVGLDSSCQPTVNVTGCKSSIGDTDLKIQADNSNFLLGMFLDSIKNGLKPQLTREFCENAIESRETLSKILAENTKQCLESTCSLVADLSCTSAPVFADEYVETFHVGEVMWKNDTRRAPIKPPPFPKLPKPSKMVTLYFSTFPFNTILFSMHRNGCLNYTFTNKDLIAKNRHLLDTDCEGDLYCICALLPGVCEGHQNATVELAYRSIGVPNLTITANGSIVNAEVGLVVYVRPFKKAPVPVANCTIKGSVTLTPVIKKQREQFTVANLRLTKVTVISGNPEVKDRLQEVITFSLIKKLNDIGKQGFPIVPDKGRLMLSGASLKPVNSTYEFASDFLYV